MRSMMLYYRVYHQNVYLGFKKEKIFNRLTSNIEYIFFAEL